MTESEEYDTENPQNDGSYREGYVKRLFDCGHWILIPDYFEQQGTCPRCHSGTFQAEEEPTEDDFEEAVWT